MIGKLSYAQIEEIIMTLENSNNNLKSLLIKYNKNDDDISMRTTKLLKFCDEIDQYINKLKDMLTLNRDVDIVINRLKNNN